MVLWRAGCHGAGSHGLHGAYSAELRRLPHQQPVPRVWRSIGLRAVRRRSCRLCCNPQRLGLSWQGMPAAKNIFLSAVCACVPPKFSMWQRRQSAAVGDATSTVGLEQVEKAKRREQTVAICVFELHTPTQHSRQLLLAQRPKDGLLAGAHMSALPEPWLKLSCHVYHNTAKLG